MFPPKTHFAPTMPFLPKPPSPPISLNIQSRYRIGPSSKLLDNQLGKLDTIALL